MTTDFSPVSQSTTGESPPCHEGTSNGGSNGKESHQWSPSGQGVDPFASERAKTLFSVSAGDLLRKDWHEDPDPRSPEDAPLEARDFQPAPKVHSSSKPPKSPEKASPRLLERPLGSHPFSQSMPVKSSSRSDASTDRDLSPNQTSTFVASFEGYVSDWSLQMCRRVLYSPLVLLETRALSCDEDVRRG